MEWYLWVNFGRQSNLQEWVRVYRSDWAGVCFAFLSGTLVGSWCDIPYSLRLFVLLQSWCEAEHHVTVCQGQLVSHQAEWCNVGWRQEKQVTEQ
jgi:hypothetical protein